MRQIPFLIRDVPMQERPRERLIKEGAKALSNQEIISIIIRTGTKEESALQLAARVLAEFDGLTLLRDASLEELCKIKGIKDAKAVEIMAAIELGRRIHNMKTNDPYIIRSPEDVSDYVMEDMRFLKQEHFDVLFLDTKNQVIHRQNVFIGSLNASIVHPREVVRP